MTARSTVLIVDDDPTALEMLCESVEELMGLEVLGAGSGPDALAATEAHSGRIDVVISDVMMPDMKGSELAVRLRERDPEIKALLISGLREQDLEQEHLLPPGARFLQKPFGLDSLTALLEEMLSGKEDPPEKRPTTRPQSYRYQLDEQDRILFVSEDWLDFAVENAAPGLTRETVIGRPIFDFIADASTRHLYELLHRQVRSHGRALSLPFRCDSPDCRRFMRLELRPLPDGGIDIESQLLREERRPFVEALDPEAERSEELIQICSFCLRVRDEARWLEIEELIECGLFDRPRMPDLTHTTCPDCSETARNAMAKVSNASSANG